MKLKGTTITCYWWPEYILEVKRQRSWSHLGSSIWWWRCPRRCWSVRVPSCSLELLEVGWHYTKENCGSQSLDLVHFWSL